MTAESSSCQSVTISWIKRLAVGKINSNILCLLQYFMPELQDLKLYMGNNYFRELASKTKNLFWKEMFMAYSTLLSMHYDNIYCQPLGNNDYIEIGNILIQPAALRAPCIFTRPIFTGHFPGAAEYLTTQNQKGSRTVFKIHGSPLGRENRTGPVYMWPRH